MRRTALITISFILCLIIGYFGCNNNSVTAQKKLLEKSHVLFKNDKLEQALSYVNIGLEKYSDIRINLLHLKYDILMKLERYDEVLEVAFEKDKFYGSKSPKKSRDIVLIYLKLNDSDNAIKWLEITVDRGFQNYSDLNKSQVFDPLRHRDEFNNLVEQIKSKIGIGMAAKNFTGETIDNQAIKLNDYIGKTVLIDFWAIYCAPCLAEINNMQKYYPDLKEKGFEILSINLDTDKDEVEKYIQKKKIEWPVVFSGNGWEDEIRKLYNLKNIPSYWLIDKSGILRAVGLEGKELENAINELIQDKSV